MAGSGVKNLPPKRQKSGSNGLRRGQVADIQRARILAAMVEVMAERGSTNITVTHIVGRAGISRRTFYELFEDLEGCFLAAFEEAVERISGLVLPEYEREGSWRAKMRAALTALLEFLEDEPSTGRLVSLEMLRVGPEALDRRGVLGQIIAVVDQGRKEVRGDNGPPPLTAEGVVGGVLSIVHSRLLDSNRASLLELTNPLMSMIVLPYLGTATAQKETQQPIPERRNPSRAGPSDPLLDLGMRLTYRTVRVLGAVAAYPGSSNRQIGVASGMHDQGQTSKLLSRLHGLGLIQNGGAGPARGAPNVWTLTEKGRKIEQAVGEGLIDGPGAPGP